MFWPWNRLPLRDARRPRRPPAEMPLCQFLYRQAVRRVVASRCDSVSGGLWRTLQSPVKPDRPTRDQLGPPLIVGAKRTASRTQTIDDK